LDEGAGHDQPSKWRASAYVFAAWVVIALGLQLLQTDGMPAQVIVLARRGPVWGVIVAAIFVVAAITYFKWWPDMGIAVPRSALLLVPPVLGLLAFLDLALRMGLPSWPIVAIVAFNTLCVGVSEELMFRGIVLRETTRRFGVRRGIVLAGVLFGAMHVLNALVTHQIGVAVAQAVIASLFGIWSGALRLRTGSVLPLIAIHWLWDGLLILLVGSTAGVVALAVLAVALSLGVYGWWLLREYPQVAETPPAPAG
jgi:hypothetical protein